MVCSGKKRFKIEGMRGLSGFHNFDADAHVLGLKFIKNTF